MKYEIMNKEDALEIEKLQEDWSREDITYGLVVETVDKINDKLTPYCFIAKDEENTIGYIMAEIKFDNKNCVFPLGVNYLFVNDLYVSKEYRSQGIGRILLEIVEKKAQEDGIEFVLLSSATKDSEAVRKFYTKNEYSIWTTVFYKNLN